MLQICTPLQRVPVCLQLFLNLENVTAKTPYMGVITNGVGLLMNKIKKKIFQEMLLIARSLYISFQLVIRNKNIGIDNPLATMSTKLSY